MSELPPGWVIQPLGDLCRDKRNSIVDGPFGSNLKRSDYLESGIPVLKIQNIKENAIILKKMDYVSKKKYQELERHSFAEGDIVMTKLGDPLGVSAIVRDIPIGLIVADLVRIRPSEVIAKFLCYQLNSPRIQSHINELQKGTTRPRVNLSMIRNLPIVTPSIQKQHQIVEILEDHLSRLDAALADVRQAKVKAAQFRSSLLNEAFVGENSSTWRSLTFRELGKWITGSTPSSNNNDFIGNEVPFVTPGDIADGGKILTVARRISKRGADAVRVVNPPSIQLVCIGATLGKVGLSDSVVTTNQQINSLEPDISVVLPEFAMWLLASAKYQRDLWSTSSSTTVPILNKGNLEKISVRLPNISDQEKILQTLEVKLSQVTQTLNTLDSLENQSSSFRRSLLQAAFMGQLTREVKNV